MTLFRAAMHIAAKDFRIELRTGEVLVHTSLFAVLVAVLASLSFYIDDQTARLVAPGVLWIAVVFAGILAMGRTWAREREFEAMRALLLTPIPRSAIFIGKAFSTMVFVTVVEGLLVFLVALFFHLDLGSNALVLFFLLFLGALGFVAAGTLFAALSVRTRARELMLSIVVFPLVAPSVLAGVVSTRELLAGATITELLGWIRILSAFDLVFVAAGVLFFDALLAD